MKIKTKNVEIVPESMRGKEYIVREIRARSKEDEFDSYINPLYIESLNLDDTEKINDLKPYELSRIGLLSLTFEPNSPLRINISKWEDDKFNSRIVIASFEEDYDGNDFYGYELVSIGDRLNSPKINWKDFGALVNLGYKWLKSQDKRLNPDYKEDD